MYFTDDDLREYDTNLKINLPLRTKEDAVAIVTAVADGTVDCITSHHQPQAWDQKTCEFEYAKPGINGLETTFGTLGTLGLPLNRVLECLSVNPRQIFGLPKASIAIGAQADLTLFIPGMEYTVNNEFYSKSKNNPFVGKNLAGKVFGLIHKNKTFLQP